MLVLIDTNIILRLLGPADSHLSSGSGIGRGPPALFLECARFSGALVFEKQKAPLKRAHSKRKNRYPTTAKHLSPVAPDAVGEVQSLQTPGPEPSSVRRKKITNPPTRPPRAGQYPWEGRPSPG